MFYDQAYENKLSCTRTSPQLVWLQKGGNCYFQPALNHEIEFVMFKSRGCVLSNLCSAVRS